MNCRICEIILTKNNTYKKQSILLCKIHQKEYLKNRRKEYPINRIKQKISRMKYESKNNKTQKRRDQRNESNKRSKIKYPERHKARVQVMYALRKGILIRNVCNECGELKTEAHHENYTKPLEIIWLCRKHHMILHNRYIEI